MSAPTWLARTPGKKTITVEAETYVEAKRVAAERFSSPGKTVSFGDVEVRILREVDLERAAKKVEAGQ